MTTTEILATAAAAQNTTGDFLPWWFWLGGLIVVGTIVDRSKERAEFKKEQEARTKREVAAYQARKKAEAEKNQPKKDNA